MSRPNQQQAMHEYLDALLFEDEAAPPPALVETEKLERLLAQATLRQQQEHLATARLEAEQAARAQLEAERAASAQLEAECAASAQLEAEFARAAQLEQARQEQQAAAAQASATNAAQASATNSMAAYQASEFQALFFEVAGLKLAVPLKSLGGIHQWQTPNRIFGKSPWYLGIMSNREESLNVVDTALWVMPEKYTDEMAATLKYQYLIMLGESKWGLSCERLVTTEILSPDDVQWRRNNAGKRPWLAGVVRDKMCAILDVEAMIDMLDQGQGSQA